MDCEEASIFTTMEDENTNTPLHLAAMFGHPDIADLLLNCGADVDVKCVTCIRFSLSFVSPNLSYRLH